MKKLLSLLLALTLVLSMGVAAFADGTDGFTVADHDITDGHGTNTSGAVVDQSPTPQTATADSTFYLTIDKDAPDDTAVPFKEEDKSFKDTEDESGNTYYIVSTESSKKDNLKFTVPLYVCMYAYGGSGRVVTPTGAAYQIENSSTRQFSSKISAVKKYIAVYNTYDEIKTAYSLGADRPTTIHDDEGYAFYYDDNDVKDIPDSQLTSIWYDADNNGAGGDGDPVYANGTGEVKKVAYIGEVAADATNAVGKTDPVVSDDNNDGNTTKFNNLYKGMAVPYVDRTDAEKGANADAPYRALGISVSTVKTVVNHTAGEWKLIKKDAETIAAKEIKMSINGLDLYETQAKVLDDIPNGLDIISLNWDVPGATVINSKDGFDANSVTGQLPLPVSAVIAGDGVNVDNADPTATDTAVLTVSYTLIPTD